MKVNILTTVLRGNFQWNCTSKNLLYTRKHREENNVQSIQTTKLQETTSVLLTLIL